MEIEWQARWSGGMKESAVLIENGQVKSQSGFARHIHHVRGGSELWRAELPAGSTILLLYRSGSGRTELARDLARDQQWDSWDAAERALQLPEGVLGDAFWAVGP